MRGAIRSCCRINCHRTKSLLSLLENWYGKTVLLPGPSNKLCRSHERNCWLLRRRFVRCRHWPTEKARIQHDLRAGTYRIGLLDRVTCWRDGQPEDNDLWAARDAVVLKALSLLLPQVLPLSTRCTHLKGHGGVKYALRQVVAHLSRCQYVLKTDVQPYYASIDHHLLLDRLARYIKDRAVLNLIVQYLRRVAERGGLYWEHTRGIALGSPLSPILGAFFLLVLAPTCWKLRAAVKGVNQVLASLKLDKHPDKTYIGRIEKGFDWLGYHLSPAGLSLAAKTIHNFATRLTRLYEQESGRPNGAIRLGQYVRRWVGWAMGRSLGRLLSHCRFRQMLACQALSGIYAPR